MLLKETKKKTFKPSGKGAWDIPTDHWYYVLPMKRVQDDEKRALLYIGISWEDPVWSDEFDREWLPRWDAHRRDKSWAYLVDWDNAEIHPMGFITRRQAVRKENRMIHANRRLHPTLMNKVGHTRRLLYKLGLSELDQWLAEREAMTATKVKSHKNEIAVLLVMLAAVAVIVADTVL